MPAAAAASRISSAACWDSSGSVSVHRQMAAPYDSVTPPTAMAASTRQCVAARFAQAVWPAAAPREIWVLCISQVRGL
jgi:hypothetical protein